LTTAVFPIPEAVADVGDFPEIEAALPPETISPVQQVTYVCLFLLIIILASKN
jgi:hypothetical protein